MNIRYVDIHSHLNFPDYDADREEVIARMKERGVATITVGTSLETSQSAVVLAEQHDNIFACIGIHPIDDEQAYFDEEAFEALVQHPKVVAVGECGLDYGREGAIDESARQQQIVLFEKQIDFAAKHDKPIMIHARNAHKDIIDILKSKKQEYGKSLRGNAHFFTGTIEEAREYHDLDFSTSFTGVVTFTRDYDEVVRSVPLEHMMSETDSPYVSPKPYRGKRNEPTYVVEVAKRIAEIKGVEEEIALKALVSNAIAKFGLVW